MNTASSRKRAQRAAEGGTSRRRPSRAEVEAAIRTLILWAGQIVFFRHSASPHKLREDQQQARPRGSVART